MKKISIILTVFDGEQSILNCLESIIKLNYPTNKFELVIVDDGSNDKTYELISSYKKKLEQKKINFHIYKFKKNLGRINSRIFGAQKAKFNRILILDVQLLMEKNFLFILNNYSDDYHLISNVYMNPNHNLINKFFYLLRYSYYFPYWGKDFKNIIVNLNNFNKIPKGTGGFVTNKVNFIEYSSLMDGKKTENEDSKLFYLYLKNKEKILKIADAKLLYINRSGFDSIKHIFYRGPRFANFYLSGIKKLLFIIILFLSLLILLKTSLYFFIISLLINILISLYFSKKINDFFILFTFLPIYFLVFISGILWGVINEIGKNEKK